MLSAKLLFERQAKAGFQTGENPSDRRQQLTTGCSRHGRRTKTRWGDAKGREHGPAERHFREPPFSWRLGCWRPGPLNGRGTAISKFPNIKEVAVDVGADVIAMSVGSDHHFSDLGIVQLFLGMCVRQRSWKTRLNGRYTERARAKLLRDPPKGYCSDSCSSYGTLAVPKLLGTASTRFVV